MKANGKDISGIKPRNPKQIAQAGMTLATGMLFLPFIPFKKAKNYKPKFKGGKNVRK